MIDVLLCANHHITHSREAVQQQVRDGIIEKTENCTFTMWLFLVLVIYGMLGCGGAEERITSISRTAVADYSLEVPCEEAGTLDSLKYKEIGCLTSTCKRVVRDGIFSSKEVAALKAITEKGMGTRASLGGPTILDINSGHIRDTGGLINLFDERINFTFTGEEFTSYGNIIRRLKSTLEEAFEIQNLLFTAPTFITRLDGAPEWQPNEIHDE